MPSGVYLRKLKPLKEHFSKKYIPEPNSGCWLWTAQKNQKGYGILWDKQKDALAHRVSWFLHHGEIPEGLGVLHHCDTPSCVNPTHLFLGTNKDNTKDMVNKGRQAKGETHSRVKLKNEDIAYIKNSTDSANKLAKHYNVTNSAIYFIRRGLTWKHIACENALRVQVGAKLSIEDVLFIRNNPKIKALELAKLYNITSGAIYHIRNRRSYKYVI